MKIEAKCPCGAVLHAATGEDTFFSFNIAEREKIRAQTKDTADKWVALHAGHSSPKPGEAKK